MTEAPVSYDAEEAGKILHRSANWMKTKARAGKIPFTRLGRQMVWTPQNLSEILRAGEQKPRPAALAARPPARRRPSADGPAVLQARPQRQRKGAA